MNLLETSEIYIKKLFFKKLKIGENLYQNNQLGCVHLSLVHVDILAM